MAAPVRIIFGDENEGIQAQGDANGNLLTREGVYDFDNETYEDTNFTDPGAGAGHYATHDFNTDAGRNAVDGYIIVDGPGNIGVDISRNTLYGSRFTMKKGERVNFTHLNIAKVRLLWSENSSYRINLI